MFPLVLSIRVVIPNPRSWTESQHAMIHAIRNQLTIAALRQYADEVNASVEAP